MSKFKAGLGLGFELCTRATLAGLCLLASGCVSQFFRPVAIYDNRKLTIQSLSLFNQRAQPVTSSLSWKGDWLFRRERLELIDQELKAAKPDLLILRELLVREGSPYDADAAILGAGALRGYEWQSVDTQVYEDSHERESMALVSGLPVRVRPQDASLKQLWRLGKASDLSAFVVSLEGESIAVFNLNISEQLANQGLWFGVIGSKIKEFLDSTGICSKRMVLAGYFGDTSSASQPDYLKMLEALQLADTAWGFCEHESLCYTGDVDNALYTATVADPSPERGERILLHRSALVYSSQRNMLSRNKQPLYASPYHLSSLAPTDSYGWISSVLFASCREPSLF